VLHTKGKNRFGARLITEVMKPALTICARGAVNFDAKVKLEERGRESQMAVVGFNLLLTTKPSIVKFEVEGTANLTDKDEDRRNPRS